MFFPFIWEKLVISIFLLFPFSFRYYYYMTANSERHSEVFVTALKQRL